MFVNLEELKSKEDMNSILQSVDTHPKLDAGFVCLFVCCLVACFL